MITERFDAYTVNYEASQEIKDAVFKAVTDWFIEHGAFSGESIMQSDEPNLDAPCLLAKIADDIIGFSVVWDD